MYERVKSLPYTLRYTYVFKGFRHVIDRHVRTDDKFAVMLWPEEPSIAAIIFEKPPTLVTLETVLLFRAQYQSMIVYTYIPVTKHKFVKVEITHD